MCFTLSLRISNDSSGNNIRRANDVKSPNGSHAQGPQSFLRGVKDINTLPQWEKDEILKKQKNQNDVQVR